MKKNFRTQSHQHQLYFDIDDKNPQTPSGQSIEIHIHGKGLRDSHPYRLKETPIKRTLSDIQPQSIPTQCFSHQSTINKSVYLQESQLKTQMAHQLIQWVIEDQLSVEHSQEKLRLSEEKIESLMKGNLTKLSFYEILDSLTQFGFNALICLRPTEKQMPGKIFFEY